MTRAIWSPQARSDLRAMLTYLRRRNPVAANRAAEDLFEAGDLLVRFPGMGRSSSIAGQRERSLPRWHTVIFYRVLNGSIEIVSLRDTRRKPREESRG